MTNREAIEVLNMVEAHGALVIEAKKMAIEALKQQEETTAKWVENENGTWSCSLCQTWIPNEQHYYANYCLYCGSRMEG